MALTRFIGDVHAKFNKYVDLLKGCQQSIQVGDFGIGFGESPRVGPDHRSIRGNHAKFNRYADLLKGCQQLIQVGDFGLGFGKPPRVGPDHRFIRGNHDDPNKCKLHPNWIPDLTVKDEVCFIGGGLSIDRQWRIEGVSWWPDEELSVNQLLDAVDGFLGLTPSVMITHDCPETVANIIGRENGYKLEYPSRTRRAFDSMFHMHQPKLWIFGHWHHSFDQTINGTRFICLDELQTIDIDLDDYR